MNEILTRMTQPKKAYDLKQKLEKLKKSGLCEQAIKPDEKNLPDTLEERIQKMLHLIKTKPQKATHMTYLIMYDIENNKVRNQIAKYLIKNGCIRIQKSVFVSSSSHKDFSKIYETLKEVQSYYDNQDSILLVPVNTTDLRSMKIIGKNIQLHTIIDKPHTLFF